MKETEKSQTTQDNEKSFTSNLDDLFDVAHKSALSQSVNPEDKSLSMTQEKKTKKRLYGLRGHGPG